MKTDSNLFRTWTIYGLALVVLGLSLAPVTAADSNFTNANWSSMGGFPGANGEVRAVVIDASGNLYIGGYFTVVGDVIAHGIAKWDGINWSPLRTGKDTFVEALAVIGSDLYAAGYITATDGIAANIAKWNGSSWSALGSGLERTDRDTPWVSALAVSGSDLYAGGYFTTAGGITANGIAKWNGSSWSALGTGFGGGTGDFVPHSSALAVSGSDLYAGGVFTTAGGVAATNIAKWDGNSWSALGSGVSGIYGFVGPVFALAVSGSDLYVGGLFTTAGGVAATNIAKWNGSGWSALGAGFLPTGAFNPVVSALAVSGSDLYVGGHFRRPKQDGFVAKWNGTNWSALGSLGTGRSGGDYVYCRVKALAVSGTDLYAGGVFGAADGDNIAKWDGNSWSALGSGSGLNSAVSSLAVSGSDLYVAGGFTTAGSVAAPNIAKWNGSGWSALGLGGVSATHLAVSGSDLYAGGYFTTAGGIWTNGIAKWDGSSWSALGSGMNDSVRALAVSGSHMYAGGFFTTAGGVAAFGIAKWDGSNWSALGSGMNKIVYALAVSGNDLYAGGQFTKAGGVAANNIAKWNGSSWTALGSGINGYVFALAVSGSDVYAGGAFTNVGAVAANGVVKWSGSSWSALGSGLGSDLYAGPYTGRIDDLAISALAVSGSDLYAGGVFTTAGGRQANYIAKWNGSSWSALGSGLSGYGIYNATYVSALAVSGSDLYAGGSFTTAGGKVSPFIARAYLLDLPALSVLRSSSDVMVSWPSANTADFTLEQSTALRAPASWAANTAIVTDDGVKKSMTLPATNGARFFRLRRP